MLEHYFLLPEHFDRAQAYVDQADALDALGRVSDAVRSLKAALAREKEYPKYLTQAYLVLPQLIVRSELRALFPLAQTVLQENQRRAVFPVDQFRWNAISALVSFDRNETVQERRKS